MCCAVCGVCTALHTKARHPKAAGRQRWRKLPLWPGPTDFLKAVLKEWI